MRKTIFAVSLLIVAVCVFSLCVLPSVETMIKTDVKVIIDAGHGNPDGGAVASDGTKESDINLSIAKKIQSVLCDKGISCILTRENEDGIYSDGSTIHAKKVSDIRNRVEIANNYPNAVFVSIHMNTFPSASVSGAQVFYKSNGNKSKEIADELQKIVNQTLQPDNHKTVKTIPSNVYLFKHIKNDSVLVECGFLTNSSDLNKLKSDEYQNEMARLISEVLIFKIGD